VPIVLKSGSLNLLEPLGPVQAPTGMALPFTVSEEGLEVLYSYRGTSARKFQSVAHTCGERMEVEWATGSSADE